LKKKNKIGRGRRSGLPFLELVSVISSHSCCCRHQRSDPTRRSSGGGGWRKGEGEAGAFSK